MEQESGKSRHSGKGGITKKEHNMKKPEPYDETIDYKDLLTRYIKHIYKEWISVPRNAEMYPPMVGKDIRFTFHKQAYDIGYGRQVTSLYVAGDVYSLGIDMDNNEPTNMDFYKLFNKIRVFGVTVMADTGLVIEEKPTCFDRFDGTVRELQSQLGC
jgi:hypothetical protein